MIVLLVAVLSVAGAEREHKVHNIILYPEKHSWCQTTPIQQVVASPGYEPVTIDNNVCVGACYSYSIPSTQPAEPGELLGPYCDSCQPSETKCYHVTLKADAKNTEGPRTFQKRVQTIMNCSCMSCGKIHQEDCEITDQSTLELPHDLFGNRIRGELNNKAKPEELPELLYFDQNKNRLPPNHFNSDTANNSKLINLLKSIQNEDDDIIYDKDELKELLKIIEGSEPELSVKNLIKLVNSGNARKPQDVELDWSKLVEVLTNLKKNQDILERHKGFGLGDGLNRYRIPLDSGAEDESKPDDHHHHKHHLGERVHDGLTVGHLVRGPHGSMVLSPTLKVEEKLNIDSDGLKPNHGGVVISYESHNKNNEIDDIVTN